MKTRLAVVALSSVLVIAFGATVTPAFASGSVAFGTGLKNGFHLTGKTNTFRGWPGHELCYVGVDSNKFGKSSMRLQWLRDGSGGKQSVVRQYSFSINRNDNKVGQCLKESTLNAVGIRGAKKGTRYTLKIIVGGSVMVGDFTAIK